MLRKNYSEDQAQVNIIIILELVEPKKVSFFYSFWLASF